jgi:hypothetical protein
MPAEWFKEVQWKTALAIAGVRKGGMLHRISRTTPSRPWNGKRSGF